MVPSVHNSIFIRVDINSSNYNARKSFFWSAFFRRDPDFDTVAQTIQDGEESTCHIRHV